MKAFYRSITYFVCFAVFTLAVSAQQVEPESYDLLFYPEGGHLIPNSRCLVAFRNVGGEPLTGYIANQRGDSITALFFHSKDMGLFQLIPQKKATYYAICRGADQVRKRIALPEVETNAYALQVNQSESKIHITWNGRGQQQKTPLLLQVSVGDYIYYQQPWEMSQKWVTLNKKDFLSGILHVRLLDTDMNPLSERPVLCLNHDQIKPEFSVSDSEQLRKKRLTLKLVFDGKQTLKGIYQVYVTKDTMNTNNRIYALYPSENLEKELKYLTPDFQNNIRNIHLYDMYALSETNPEEIKNIELEGIEVSATRKESESNDIYEKFADYKITSKEIEKLKFQDFRSLIYKIPGLMMRGNCIILQRTGGMVDVHIDGTEIYKGTGGTTTFNESNEGNSKALQEIDISDIETVSLIKGGNGRSVFGARGFNGILSVKTKKGKSRMGNRSLGVIEQQKNMTHDPDSSIEDVLYANIQQKTNEHGELKMDIDTRQAKGSCNINIYGYTDNGIIISGSVLVHL